MISCLIIGIERVQDIEQGNIEQGEMLFNWKLRSVLLIRYV